MAEWARGERHVGGDDQGLWEAFGGKLKGC